jgi:peptide/nickel transport system permease protein
MKPSRVQSWKRSLEPRLKEWRFNIYRIRNNPISLLGFGLIFFNVVLAAVAPILAAPNTPNPYKIPKIFSTEPMPPSSEHPFGTSGPSGYYDIYYGVVWGSRMSLSISFTVIFAALIIGVLIGTVSGMYGGVVDEVIMRITDVFFALPGLVLAMAVASVLGRTITNLMYALIITWWPGFARLIRGEVLKIKQETYVEASRSVGAGMLTIMFKHVLPNAIFPILIISSMQMGTVVMAATTLSFLGLGAEPGTAEWGAIISEGRNWMLQGAWWTTLFPGMAIFIYVLGWNLLGDAFRDILDPKLRRIII